MKQINLLSLIQARRSLRTDIYEEFAKLHSIEIRSSEVDDLDSLVQKLLSEQPKREIVDGYYVGYKIPQIGKEFDLLRFGANYNLNIEVKSDCDEEKMQRQLLRNRYYLGYLGRPLHNISFSSANGEFYRLRVNGTIDHCDVKEVVEILSEQQVEIPKSIDERFQPSNYLVSPFNSPEKFLANGYFLTSQQENFKAQAMQRLAPGGPATFLSLTGSAGTGKTLLAYDIVAELIRLGGAPLIVHCGNLNSGQCHLIGAGWAIIPVKALRHCDLTRFDTILLDEAQRIRPHQFSSVVAHVQATSGKCIFSFDRSQTLADYEIRNNVSAQIDAIPGIVTYALSERIRTNKEIATFIKGFFNIGRGLKTPDTGNIEVHFFATSDDAREYISTINEAEWRVLRFTPSQYNNEHHESYSSRQSSTSHEVIGQEFDGVVVVVDQFFTYNAQGNLVYTGSTYYQPVKMLFQNMTRARTKLKIVVINNSDVLRACLNILQ